MPTEALHTPLLQDRYLSIRNARYVFEACRGLSQEISFRPGGMIERRANDVLAKAVDQLERVRAIGLFEALRRGEFADVSRDPHGGRGLEGVVAKRHDYFNPFFAALRDGRITGPPGSPAGAASAPADAGGTP
jgi:beta-lysine 5,6-aminomutase alpha subunit